MMDDEEFEKVYLLGGTKTHYYYLKGLKDIDTISKKRSSVSSVFMSDPPEYLEAIALYEDRKYSEAYTKFGEVMEKYNKFQPIPDNHYTRSEFYQLECLRKQLKTAELVKAVADFRTENLIRKDLLQQVEVYKFWEAVNTKSWGRLDRLAGEWKTKRIPISQRAQVAYCHALALEGLERHTDALNAYATAMTADYSKSEEIARAASQNALRVYKSIPEVKTAMTLWGTEDEDQFSQGYRLLVEANALARLYNKAGLGAGVSLPSAYAEFLKFTPKNAEE